MLSLECAAEAEPGGAGKLGAGGEATRASGGEFCMHRYLLRALACGMRVGRREVFGQGCFQHFLLL